jgi:hypothetical protein
LRVADTGVGIPAHALPHVFDRFYRVPNARARTHDGAGIGLALVHELVRLMGGTIAVESEAGAGTTFTVTMPRHAAAADAVAASADAAGAGRERSLVQEHTEEATVQNFEVILPHLAPAAVVVVDDIMLEGDMQRAWARISAHPRVSYALGLRRLGLVVVGAV